MRLEVKFEKHRKKKRSDWNMDFTWKANGFFDHTESHSVVSDSLWPHELYSPWNSPGQNTGVGSLSLLQGIFPTQGWNPGLLHCRRILYQLRHKGSPRTLEWVAYPFSSWSSGPRNWTRVSCIAGRFFTELSGKPCVRMHSIKSLTGSAS